MNLESLLADAATIGPFFTIEHSAEAAPPQSREEVSPGREQDDDEPDSADFFVRQKAVIESTRKSLRTSENRVAESIYFQGFAARLWSPVLAIALSSGVVLDLDPEDTTYDGSSLRTEKITATTPTDVATELYRVVVERHLEPIAATLSVSEQVLWGNVASALIGSYGVLVRARPEAADPAVIAELLATGKLAGTGIWSTSGSFSRNSCCLYYRAPGGGLCGDCVLHRR